MSQWFRKIANNYSNRFVSRWLILCVDLSVVFVCFFLAYLLRFNLKFDRENLVDFGFDSLIVLPVYLIAFLFTKSYEGIVRHTSITDAVRVLAASSGALVVLGSLTLLERNLELSDWNGVPHSISIIHFLIATFFLIGTRFLGKSIYFVIKRDLLEDSEDVSRVLIYGAGTSGLITKKTLEQERSKKIKVVGFIDDNPTLQGKRLEGVSVLDRKSALNGQLEKKNVNEVIFSIQNIPLGRKQRLINECLEQNLRVKSVPPVASWINGQLSANQIRNVSIDDLLGREAIKLSNQNIRSEVEGKVVLVTGAAGSIGSEIARQVFAYGASQLILIDQAESALFDVEQELLEKKQGGKLVCCVADVCNMVRMNYIFDNYQPDLVYHAAAYKHVPMMELNPTEAANVNILGTKTIADLSLEYNVDKFVLVSTDKAVNPTNIMGATKRAAEMYCRTLEMMSEDTHFITTRFGNVLGSNGSVIPTFRKQIEKGGPIKVTHKDITRYFMTIPEACSLVLEAGAMGKGGEIYIFDMGESIKIVDLAKKMIKLSGLEEGKDIEIQYSGLRPGEKLYEELLADEENTTKTHHEKIMIAKLDPPVKEHVDAGIAALSKALENDQVIELVSALKAMVPEFKSKNSEFEKLDTILKD